MLWDKTKYAIQLRRGRGECKTSPMHGLIQQIVVTPKNPLTVWSMDILDGDLDMIYTRQDWEGRLDDKDGLPVGRDKPECLSVRIYDATENDKFEVVFKLKEVR